MKYGKLIKENILNEHKNMFEMANKTFLKFNSIFTLSEN